MELLGGPGGRFAGLRRRLSVCHRYFNLPQLAHDLLWTMLLSSRNETLLSYQFASFSLVQETPGRPPSETGFWLSQPKQIAPEAIYARTLISGLPDPPLWYAAGKFG